MKKNLSEYFIKAIETGTEAFPFDDEKLRSIAESESSPRFKLNQVNKRGVIIMTSICLVIASFFTAFLLMTGGDNNASNSNMKNGSEQLGKGLISQSQPGISTKNASYESTAEKIDLMQLYTGKGSMKIDGYVPLLILNNEELKKLNIKLEKEGFIVATESKYDMDGSRFLRKELKENNYPRKGIYRLLNHFSMSNLTKEELLPYKNWNMEKSAGQFPIALRTDYINELRGTTNYRCSFGYSPLVDEQTAEGAQNNDFDKISHAISQVDFDKKYTFKGNELLGIDKSKFPFADKFIAVLIQIREKDSQSDVVVWYPPTPEIMNNLPERYKNIVPKSKIVTDIVTSDPIDLERYKLIQQAEEDKFVSFDKNIGGIQKLILTDAELAKVGIVKKDGEYTVMTEERYVTPNDLTPLMIAEFKKMGFDPNLKQGISRSLLKLKIPAINKSPLELEPIKYSGWDMVHGSKTMPVGVTIVGITTENYNDKTIHNVSMTEQTFNSPLLDKIDQPEILALDKQALNKNKTIEFRPKIERLLPVHISIGNKNDPDSTKWNYADYDIWFYVNREFAELLPERYRTQILQELNLIDGIENKQISADDACDELKGKRSFFGLCNTASQTIQNALIFPNPVTGDNCNLTFNLSKEGDISLYLYDSNGGFLKSLQDAKHYQKGKQIIPMNLNKVYGNVLLLEIVYNNSEHIVLRFLKK